MAVPPGVDEVSMWSGGDYRAEVYSASVWITPTHDNGAFRFLRHMTMPVISIVGRE